jgi:hypothetical protein
MRIMAVGDASDGMTEDFDRRLRHVRVVVRRTRFAEILEFPWFILTGLDVRLKFDAGEVAELLEPSVWA